MLQMSSMLNSSSTYIISQMLTVQLELEKKMFLVMCFSSMQNHFKGEGRMQKTVLHCKNRDITLGKSYPSLRPLITLIPGRAFKLQHSISPSLCNPFFLPFLIKSNRLQMMSRAIKVSAFKTTCC